MLEKFNFLGEGDKQQFVCLSSSYICTSETKAQLLKGIM